MEKEKISRIFKRIPKLSTERILLRKIEKKYAKDVYEYARHPEVTRFLLWDAHKDPTYSRDYVNYLQGLYREGSFYDWGIVLRDGGHLIGTCGFTRFDFENCFFIISLSVLGGNSFLNIFLNCRCFLFSKCKWKHYQNSSNKRK